MKVVTCCHHSVVDLVAMIKEWNPEVTIGLLSPETLRDKQCRPDLMICSATALQSARSRLERIKRGVLLVVDSAAQCSQLGNAIHLDLVEQKPSFRAKYRRITQRRVSRIMDRCIQRQQKPRPIEINKIDPVTALIEQQLSSILNPISSFLYTVRDPDDRKKFQRLVYGWLISERKPRWLLNKAMRMGGYTKIPKALAGLVETVEQGDKPRKAFRELMRLKHEGKPINYKRISRQYQVSTFDLRYTMSVITSLRLK